MEKSYGQLKQRFNPQVPSVEIPAGMIEGGTSGAREWRVDRRRGVIIVRRR